MLTILPLLFLSSFQPAAAQEEPPPLRQPGQVNKPADAPLPDEEGATVLSMGTLQVDAKVPAEIVVNGQRIGQLFLPSALRVPLPAGTHELSVVREGKPEELTVEIPEDDATLLVIGRTGTTVGPAALPDEELDPHAPIPVELRVVGEAQVQLRMGDSRLALAPGQLHTLHLAPGQYPMDLRNQNGTVIWARGKLDVRGGDNVVVQLSEGRLPELTGDARFLSSRK